MMAQAVSHQQPKVKAVNVMDIVDARSQEITSAMEALKTCYAVSQSLTIPFHMRRRACGYNPKRRPKRLQYDNLPKLEKPKDKKGNKKKKKGVSKGEYVRMETHVWHAKRCHMKDMWGYRLAMTTTQKGDRAVHRAVKSACVLQDTSFYTFLFLSGNSLHDTLSDVMKPNPCFESCVNRVIRSHLYTKGLERCIAPVEVFWQSRDNVMFRVHPASLSDVSACLSTLQDVKVVSYKDKISQFSLVGVRALELFVHALPFYSLETLPSYTSNIINELKSNPYQYELSKGAIMDFKVNVPKPEFQRWNNIAKGNISQPSVLLHPDKQLNTGVFWEHMTTQSTDLPPVLPSFIYRDPDTSQLTIVLPSGTGNKLWLKLVYNGGRVIGLNDHRYLITEEGLPCYPYDYPDTPAGVTYELTLEAERREKQVKRPPQKRNQYERLGIAHPYRPDWSSLCEGGVRVVRSRGVLTKLSGGEEVEGYDEWLIVVNISSLKRGTVDAGSALYRPLDTDLITDPSYDSESCSREIVGWVTSGKYSLSDGAGGGLGLVSVKQWRSVKGVVLVRRNSSRQFRRVRVEIVL